MKSYTLWHNSRCSKSRACLTWLEENNISVTVKNYLDDTPSYEEIERVLAFLNCSPRDLMRKKETEYKTLGLEDSSLSTEELIKAMLTTPKLIERPIVIGEKCAAIGRPLDNVIALIHTSGE